MNSYYKYNDLDSREYPNKRLKRKTITLTKNKKFKINKIDK